MDSISRITQVTEQQLNDYCEKYKLGLKTISQYYHNYYNIKALSKFDFSKPMTDEQFDKGIKALTEEGWLIDKSKLFELDRIYYLITHYGTILFSTLDLSFDKKLELIGDEVLQDLNQTQLDEYITEIKSMISKAEAFADETKGSISLNTAYGMGGTYYGSTQEWEPSSQSC